RRFFCLVDLPIRLELLFFGYDNILAHGYTPPPVSPIKNLNSSWKMKSTPPRKMPTTAESPTTAAVNLVASSRDGHSTFRSSWRVSRRRAPRLPPRACPLGAAFWPAPNRLKARDKRDGG